MYKIMTILNCKLVKDITYINLMETSNFLITDYINNNSELNKDDITKFRKDLLNQGIFTKDYPDDNILLLYNKFENKNKNDLEMECRSVILNRTTFDIICYTCNTPIYNINAVNYLLKNSDIEKEIFKCYEGTLMSMFYFNNKWYLSTRRCLDSQNSLWNDESHYNMFIETLNENDTNFEEFTENLNKDFCYYFILIHHKNKNLVDYTKKFGENYKKLCLAFIRNKKDQSEIKNDNLSFIKNNIFLPEKIDNLESFDKENQKYKLDEKPDSEGVIIKIKKDNKYKLLKLQNLNYQFHTAMGNKKNIFLGFIYLYQNNKLSKYLHENDNFSKFKKIINPINTNESYDTLGTVDSIFKVLTSELFILFKLLWNLKTCQHQNKEVYDILPKEYKKILFKIRGIFFEVKNSDVRYLKLNHIYNHLKSISSLEIEKLLRSRKLMMNWVKSDQNNKYLKIFSKISEKCDKVHLKLTAIYTSILFPQIMPDDIPK